MPKTAKEDNQKIKRDESLVRAAYERGRLAGRAQIVALEVEVFRNPGQEYREAQLKNGEWKIVIIPGWRAQVKGRPECWSVGRGINEALGSLMMSHSELLRVEVNVLSKPPA